jgi:hypothetical protein
VAHNFSATGGGDEKSARRREGGDSETANYEKIKAYFIAQHNSVQCINK